MGFKKLRAKRSPVSILFNPSNLASILVGLENSYPPGIQDPLDPTEVDLKLIRGFKENVEDMKKFRAISVRHQNKTFTNPFVSSFPNLKMTKVGETGHGGGEFDPK